MRRAGLTRAFRAAWNANRPAIRRLSSMPGRAAYAGGPKAACRRSCASGGNRISPSITAQEYAEIKEARENLLAKYGADFGAPYGWASKRLGHKATRFSDIEEIAGAKYVRPFYKSASGNVHASSGGTLVRLGQPPDVDGLVTGASAFGLARPAIGAAHSLALAAVSFATMTASPDAMAYAMAMNTFAEETSSAFEVAERRTYGSLGRRSS